MSWNTLIFKLNYTPFANAMTPACNMLFTWSGGPNYVALTQNHKNKTDVWKWQQSRFNLSQYYCEWNR